MNASDVFNVSPEEFQKILRARRVKKQSQINQKRYRAKSKEKHLALGGEVQEQKNRIQRMSEYYDLLCQKKFIRQDGAVQFRGVLLNSYFDLFRFSAAKKTDSMFEKQRSFLELNWDNEFKLTPQSKVGYEPVLEQWDLVSQLSEKYTSKKTALERIDADGQVFRMRLSIAFNMTPSYVTMMYPHMITEPDFLYKVVGKQLVFDSIMTFRFGENNQIISLSIENDLGSGWMRILKDPILTARVLKQAQFNESTIIIKK